MAKLPSFSDLYLRLNNLFDRRIEGITTSPAFKVFPDSAAASQLNINVNHKTLAGQKFKLSFAGKGIQGKDGLSVSGKFAAEPFLVDKEHGLEANLILAKKDGKDARSTIEIAGKYAVNKEVGISVTAKVDKTQSVGVKASYGTDAISGSLEISRVFDWYLFRSFAKTLEPPVTTDITVEALAALDDKKEWVAGGALNLSHGESFGIKNFTLAGARRQAASELSGFARVDWANGKAISGGFNIIAEVEKDVTLGAEAVVRPRAGAAVDELFDYTVAVSLPFSSGSVSARFGLDSVLGLAYTQALNSNTKLSVGTATNTADLSKASYAVTLTFES